MSNLTIKKELSLLCMSLGLDYDVIYDKIGLMLERRVEQAIVDTINEIEDVMDIVLDDPSQIIEKVKKQVDQDNGKN